MDQLLKNEVETLLKSRQARNKSIGPFPTVSMQCFDIADALFDLVDAKTGAIPVVKAHTLTRMDTRSVS